MLTSGRRGAATPAASEREHATKLISRSPQPNPRKPAGEASGFPPDRETKFLRGQSELGVVGVDRARNCVLLRHTRLTGGCGRWR